MVWREERERERGGALFLFCSLDSKSRLVHTGQQTTGNRQQALSPLGGYEEENSKERRVDISFYFSFFSWLFSFLFFLFPLPSFSSFFSFCSFFDFLFLAP